MTDQHAELGRGHYGYRYHVPLTHERGAPPPPILLTVDGMTEEVADYMGRHYLCEMATLGSRLETCPGRLGRLARWIVRRARFEPALIDGTLRCGASFSGECLARTDGHGGECPPGECRMADQSDGLATGGVVSREAAEEIARSIGQHGCVVQRIDGGDGA